MTLRFLLLTHSGVATNGPELVTEEDRPIDFLSVRDVPGVLGGVGSPTERASTSLDSDSLAGLRTSFTDTAQTKKKNECLTNCLQLTIIDLAFIPGSYYSKFTFKIFNAVHIISYFEQGSECK